MFFIFDQFDIHGLDLRVDRCKVGDHVLHFLTQSGPILEHLSIHSLQRKGQNKTWIKAPSFESVHHLNEPGGVPEQYGKSRRLEVFFEFGRFQ